MLYRPHPKPSCRGLINPTGPLSRFELSCETTTMSVLSPCRAALLQCTRSQVASSTGRRALAAQWHQRRLASTKHPTGFSPPAQADLDELRERTIEFARREIPNEVAQKVDHSNEFPMDMWKKMGEAGFLGITADEHYGGLAMGYQAHCTVMEELSRASGMAGNCDLTSCSCVDGRSSRVHRSLLRCSQPTLHQPAHAQWQ